MKPIRPRDSTIIGSASRRDLAEASDWQPVDFVNIHSMAVRKFVTKHG